MAEIEESTIEIKTRSQVTSRAASCGPESHGLGPGSHGQVKESLE